MRGDPCQNHGPYRLLILVLRISLFKTTPTSIQERETVHVMSLWAIDTLRRIAAELATYQDGRYITNNTLTAYRTSLQLVYRNILMNAQCANNRERVCDILQEVFLSLEDIEYGQSVQCVEPTLGLCTNNGCVGKATI